MSNDTLLVIDAQVDFHDVPGAALPVPGSTADTARLSSLIPRLNPNQIICSLDTHAALDISHPGWWIDAKGQHPNPFTPISADDVRNGVWNAVIDPHASLKYVEDLEANGEFGHFILPLHCIQGSAGHALMPDFLTAINDWSVKRKKWINFITKGANPYTEHFGIFRANVPHPNDPSTNINQKVFAKLNNSDRLFIAGQARTHCVANSLTQLLAEAPQLASKLYVLEDCMSNVAGLPAGFYNQVDGIYADAAKKGVQFIKSTDI